MSYMNVSGFCEKRAEKIREYLAERDMKALAVLDSLNTVYVSGFELDVAPWERPVVTLIPLDGEPVMLLNELSINHYKYGLEKNVHWIKDVRYYDEHPRMVGRRYYTREFPLLLKEVLEEKGIWKGRVGVDSSLSKFTGWVKPHLPDVCAVDAGYILREMRLVKDEYELYWLRKSGEITTWGQDVMKKAIKPGKSHVELSMEVAYALAIEAAKRFPSDVSIKPGAGFTGTGPDGAMPHGWRRPSGRKVQVGDSLLDGLSCRYNAYSVEDERTWFIGEPSEKQKRFFEVMTEAQQAGIDMCVAGNKVSDIDAAALKIIEDAGFGDYVFHRTGHGMGLGGHEYWGDMAFNHLVMKPGMVTSVEPALFVYGLGGFRHSDCVVVGKDKPEVLTTYSKELEDLIIHV